VNQERIATLQSLVDQDPEDVFSLYALGLEYLESDNQRSQTYFTRVLDLEPNYVAAYFQLGKLYAAAADEGEARHWLELGMNVAGQVGDQHALEEMQDFLDGL
jgi:tetratricopeptide (TPR) repeat protein